MSWLGHEAPSSAGVSEVPPGASCSSGRRRAGFQAALPSWQMGAIHPDNLALTTPGFGSKNAKPFEFWKQKGYGDNYV